MRKAYKDVAIGKIEGIPYICSGFDFCAEHEWGIARIQSEFDCFHSDIIGIERYRVNKVPDGGLLFFDHIVKGPHNKKVKRVVLAGGDPYYLSKDYINRNITFYDNDVMSMWDEKGFCLSALANTPEADILKEIYGFLKEKDAVIFTKGRSNPFGGSGIVITPLSMFPKDAAQNVKEQHEDAIRLEEASDATGIVQVIDLANKKKEYFSRPCGYFALSPRWTHENEKDKTKYSVIYWLNPENQQNNNCGWFTVEELEKWLNYRVAEDKSNLDPGPIPKLNKK